MKIRLKFKNDKLHSWLEKRNWEQLRKIGLSYIRTDHGEYHYWHIHFLNKNL